MRDSGSEALPQRLLPRGRKRLFHGSSKSQEILPLSAPISSPVVFSLVAYGFAEVSFDCTESLRAGKDSCSKRAKITALKIEYQSSREQTLVFQGCHRDLFGIAIER